MLPEDKDLILRKSISLYNNNAHFSGSEGRLSANFEIFPIPRISWSFERLGPSDIPLPRCWEHSQTPAINGYCFSIEEPRITNESSRIGPSETRSGDTTRVSFGNIQTPGHSFKFYIPNLRCIHETFPKGKIITKYYDSSDQEQEIGLREHGCYLQIEIGNYWLLKIFSSQDSRTWLESRARNIGTLLTAEGTLRPKNSPHGLENFDQAPKELTNAEFTEFTESLGAFLSFPNGGYTRPLYTEISQYRKEQDDITISKQQLAGIATNYLTTTLEDLAQTWVTNGVSLQSYLDCFLCFRQMMRQQQWKDSFHFVLNQYFQATSPKYKGWQIRASSIGAALERLSHTVLVQDELDTARKAKYDLLFNHRKTKQARREWNLGNKAGQEDISKTEKRTCLLLERIGLSRQRNFGADLDNVSKFLNLRNESVHPKQSDRAVS